MKSLILFAFSESTESTKLDALSSVEAEITDNLNQAVENANNFIQSLEKYLPKIIAFGINVCIAIAIFAVGKIVIGILMKIVKKFFKRANIEISVQKFLISLIRAILYFILFIILCNQVGIQTTSFVALLSTASLTIGLALQGSFSNFAGGVLILLIKPFKVGDYIVDGSSGTEGTVQKIDLFYTMIVTPDNKLITIPNGNLSNTHITNASAFEKRRVDITVGISYESDMEKAKETVRSVGMQEPAKLAEEDVFVGIKALAESEVTIVLRVWVKTQDYWDAYFRMNEQLKKELDKAGIEIPYNQLDVHVTQKE
ncbi:MAG: mechanosensitive ion channel [Lachnospiraceae bacterium]|jgi:Small-conductance mechanosensitive channel|nr:mechanosensitive ion channel [Lachnospiraceae bacterium]